MIPNGMFPVDIEINLKYIKVLEAYKVLIELDQLRNEDNSCLFKESDNLTIIFLCYVVLYSPLLNILYYLIVK